MENPRSARAAELLTISVDKFVRNRVFWLQAIDSYRKIKKIKNEADLRHIKPPTYALCFCTFFVDKIVRKRAQQQ